MLKTKYKILNYWIKTTFNATWKTHQFHHHRPCKVKAEGALLRHCNSKNWVRFASKSETGSEFLNEIPHSFIYHCNFTQMVSKILIPFFMLFQFVSFDTELRTFHHFSSLISTFLWSTLVFLLWCLFNFDPCEQLGLLLASCWTFV